jgi:PAS domain S-box-containing protein
MNQYVIPPQILLDHLLDATPDTGIAIVDAALDLVYLNSTAADYFHCSPEQVLGRSIREHHISSQRSRERFDRAVEQVRRGEAFEYCIEQSLDERVRYLGVRISGLWEAQRLIGYLVIVRDITQRHLAEIKLAAEEAHYRTLYEQAPVPYHSLDADARIRHVNDAWLETFGYRKEEIIGKSIYDLLMAPGAELFKRGFERFKRIGKVHEVEFALRHADGRAVTVLLFGRAVYSAAGAFDHTHCILIDITQQREMEAQLNRSEARYRNLFEKTRDALLLFDAQTLQIEDANPAAIELFGYSREELLQLALLQLSADREKTLASIDPLRRGQAHEASAQRRFKRHKDGHTMPVEVVAAGFELAGRTKLFSAMRDITQSVQLEQELENQRLQLSTLLETIPYGIEEADLQGSILYANPAYHRLFGYQPGELLGHSVWTLMLDDEMQRMKRLIRTRLFEEMPVPETIHAKARRKDGQEIDIQIDWDYRRDADNRITGTISVITDITLRNRTEQALRDSEARFRSIFDDTGASIGIADISGRMLSVNQAMCEFLGYTREELLSMNFAQFTHPEEHASSLEMFGQTVDGKTERYRLEKRYLRKDGSVRWGLLSTTLVRDEVGLPSHVIGLIQDISDRIGVEQALRENQELFSLFMDNLPAAVSIKDDAGRLRFVNRYLEQHFDAGSWLGRTTRELFPGETGRRIHEAERLALQQGHHERIEKLTERDGLERNYQCCKFAIPRQDGSPYLGSIDMDISQQMKTRNELELTRFALDRAGEAVLWVGADTHFVYANDAACRALGYSRDELLRLGIHDLDPGCPRAAYEAIWQRVKAEGTVRMESTHRRKDGSEIPVGITASYLMFDDQEYNCIIVRDLSEQRRVHQQLQQAHKMEALGQLTGGIAHDFNNILASILGFADLSLIQLEHGRSDKLSSYVKEIQTAGRRGKSLVDQMLRFSRSDGSRPQPLSLQPLVKEIIQLLGSTLPSSILIEAQVDGDTPQIMADPVQMHQALMNLCINARDAMDGKGVLRIGLQLKRVIQGSCSTCHADMRGEWVTLTVSDNGSGIPDKIRERIFDPFFTTKEVGRGTGMGLAVVHGIMLQHQGHVQFESRIGTGTQFHLMFPPAAAAAVRETTQAASVADPGKSISGSVLVVDDEPAVLQVICAYLEQAGLEIYAAGDSETALERFRDSPEAYDLLVVDQTMPKLTGTELAQQVHRLRPDLPVILCTGHSERINEENIAEFGISRYLRKPVERETLIETLSSLLG